jgi:succinate dehydrogenase hydrophobic anchor subunit
VVFYIMFFVRVAAGQRGGDTFFSNPWLASTILPAAALATVAAAVGLIAVFRDSERAVAVFVIIAIGIAVFLFAAAEAVFPH